MYKTKSSQTTKNTIVLRKKQTKMSELNFFRSDNYILFGIIKLSLNQPINQVKLPPPSEIHKNAFRKQRNTFCTNITVSLPNLHEMIRFSRIATKRSASPTHARCTSLVKKAHQSCRPSSACLHTFVRRKLITYKNEKTKKNTPVHAINGN